MTKSLLRRTGQKIYFDSGSAEVSAEPSAEDRSAAPDSSASVPSARREHDTCVGRRMQEKVFLSPDELKPPLLPDPVRHPDGREVEELLKNDTVLPRFGKIVRGVLLLTAAVGMFFIITQAASFLASVRHLSLAEQILLTVPAVIFGLIILWYFIKALLLFRRLRVSPQIGFKALQVLSERREMRELSRKANRAAVNKLSSLLKDRRRYASKDHPETLRKLDVAPEQVKALDRARQKLISEAENLPGTSLDWVVEFREKFQSQLDEIAGKRIRKYYIHAGVMTGISPYPLFDRLIVFRACLAMLKELLVIYAVKPSWDKNLVLLAQVILNTYLAGVIDHAAESGVDLVMDNLPELTNVSLSRGLDLIIRKGGGKGAGMLTQAYLVYRLGIAAMKMLRPVCDAPK